MRVYGITGGIGAGKSAVTTILREKGYTVIDLDQVARDVVKPGSHGVGVISDAFGAAYLNLDGSLNRKMLADLVFNDPKELEKLDALMGPLLWEELERRKAELEGDLAFVDAALIIEKRLHENLDGVILVTAPEEMRMRRAMRRDGATEEHVRSRIASQMPDSEKRKHAQFVVDNIGTLEDLETEVTRIVEALRQ